LNITGVNFGLGKRLKWPDDYFTLFQGIEIRRFDMQGYSTGALGLDPRIYGERLYTKANNINYKAVLSRNNTDVPIFPTRGSQFMGSMEITPPFSLLSGKNFDELPSTERLRWIEYHKWMFSADWFAPLGINNKLVFRSHASFGFLGTYNRDLGTSPFERFYLGGSGLQNFQIDGREIIPLRGYPDQSLIPGGGTMYNKFLLETRFLISPNPSAQIFMLAFLEAGNNTNDYFRYRPFELKRAAGAGLRIFMPMFGLLGLDLGYGFDNIPGTFGRSGWQTHFIIGQQF
jgi:outer membrane protein insertion porin family